MAISTVQDLIVSSMRLVNISVPGETPNTDELSDGLDTLNALYDSLSNEKPVMYTMLHENFTLTPGTIAYTLGPGGTITTRPVRVLGATCLSGEFRQGMDILSMEQFASLDDGLGLTAGMPTKLGVDNGYPSINLRVWPTPNLAGAQIELYVLQAITQFASLATTLAGVLPPGWIRALRFNLAVDLAVEYGKPLDQGLVQLAMQSKGALAGANPDANPQQPAPAGDTAPKQ